MNTILGYMIEFSSSTRAYFYKYCVAMLQVQMHMYFFYFERKSIFNTLLIKQPTWLQLFALRHKHSYIRWWLELCNPIWSNRKIVTYVFVLAFHVESRYRWPRPPLQEELLTVLQGSSYIYLSSNFLHLNARRLSGINKSVSLLWNN